MERWQSFEESDVAYSLMSSSVIEVFVNAFGLLTCSGIVWHPGSRGYV